MKFEFIVFVLAVPDLPTLMAAHDPVACDFGFDRLNSPNVSYNNLLLFPYNSLQFFCCQINRIKSELGLCMSFIVFIHDGPI